jgi:hypothetical protein
LTFPQSAGPGQEVRASPISRPAVIAYGVGKADDIQCLNKLEHMEEGMVDRVRIIGALRTL